MMKRIFSTLAALLLAAGAWMGSVAFSLAYAASGPGDLPGGPGVNQLNLAPGVTVISREQHWLNWFMMIVCTAVFVIVFAVMFYSIWKHRKSVGHKAANFHESVVVEIAWTVVPFVIVVAMGLMATKSVVAMKDTTNADLTIKATGMQWKWGYDYLKGQGEGIAIISTLDSAHREMSNNGGPKKGEVMNDYLLKVDFPLVVPVDKKIRIVTTANDVIHAFAIPALGIQQDAIPGFVRDTWFRAEAVGDYYGQCAKLCGKEHSYMPIHVKVLSADDYSAWVVAEQKKLAAKADDPTKVWTLEDISKRGEKVYAQNCAACHQANGKGAGAIKALDGSAVVLDADHAKQIAVLLNGQNNGAMPSWKALSDTDIAAVISYTKNNWSNKTGQVVQPAEVLALRK